MAGETTETVIDITKRFEWEVSREWIEECEVNKRISSPVFTVNTGNVVSEWKIIIWPNWQGHIPENIRAIVAISLLSGDVSLKMEVEGIGVKTETGYVPGKPLKVGRSKMVSKIEYFNGRSTSRERTCYVKAGSREDFLKLIKNNNKIKVVAILRFYVDRNDYIEKKEMEQVFVTQIRSISFLDSLADFTVICGNREFKCIGAILASRSTVFKAMLLNDSFMENRENLMTIENASPDSVEAMLEYISKAIVPQDIKEKAIDLIDLADKYDLQVSSQNVTFPSSSRAWEYPFSAQRKWIFQGEPVGRTLEYPFLLGRKCIFPYSR